jgi:hypothetical protein
MPACDGKLFSKFKTGNVFIETGSYIGDGVQAALWAGFDKIYTVELSKKHYDFTVNRFVGNEKIKCVFGDSVVELNALSKEHKDDGPLFWLDAHATGDGHTTRNRSLMENLEMELDVISSAISQGHALSILIDDVRDGFFSWVEERLRRHWPNSDITHEDGCGGKAGGFKPMPNSIIGCRIKGEDNG